MDNLNAHSGASLYKAFPPEECLNPANIKEARLNRVQGHIALYY